jgi:hypothetical protein
MSVASAFAESYGATRQAHGPCLGVIGRGGLRVACFVETSVPDMLEFTAYLRILADISAYLRILGKIGKG